jgi:hypothetical protein
MSKSLPSIPVKHVPVRKVLNFPKPLDAKLRAYIAYYTETHGLDPKQSPSESDTIVALLETYLARDAGFNRHLRSASAQRADRDEEHKSPPQRHNVG